MSETKLPFAKWFWTDWLADLELRQCDVASRGVWADLLAVAGQNQARPGHCEIAGVPLDAEGVSKLCGITVERAQTALADLEKHHVFSRDRNGTIYSRRIVRDRKRCETNRENGARGAAATPRGRKGKFQSPRQSDGRPIERTSGQDDGQSNGRDDGRTDERPVHPQKLEARLHTPENQKTSTASVAARVLANVTEEDIAWQKLASDVNEVFERISVWPMTPILHFDTWRQRGYQPAMVLEVVRRGIKRDTRTLTYFDKALDEEHRKRQGNRQGIPPKPITEAIPLIDGGWDGGVAAYKRGGMWFTAWGPPPDQPGCRAPREVLAKHYPDLYPALKDTA